MTLQRKIEKIILELEDIRDEAGYTDESASVQRAIDALREVRIYSDQMI
jgi:hypothetical protein